MSTSLVLVQMVRSPLLAITTSPRPGEQVLAEILSYGHGSARTSDGRTFRVYADWTVEETTRSIRNRQQ